MVDQSREPGKPLTNVSGLLELTVAMKCLTLIATLYLVIPGCTDFSTVLFLIACFEYPRCH